MEENNKDLNLNFMPLGKSLKPYLGIIIFLAGLLIFSLIIFTIALTSNKIKENSYIGQGMEFKNTITVEGEGIVEAKPDIGMIELSVLSQAKTVVAAQQDNTKKINEIIKTLKEQGIEEKDLKTTNYNINPRYQYLAGKSEIIGYEISQTVQIKIRNLEKIGDIITKSASLGANQAGSLQFTFDNPQNIQNEARGKAIENAKEKTAKLAKQLGVKLVRIVNFNESGIMPTQPLLGLKTAEFGGGGETAPQIQVGQNEIISNVSITYEIK